MRFLERERARMIRELKGDIIGIKRAERTEAQR